MRERHALLGCCLRILVDFVFRLILTLDIGPRGGCFAETGGSDRSFGSGSFVQVDSAKRVGRVKLLLLRSVLRLDCAWSLGSLG